MSESLFGFLLDLEIAKAQRLRYCVSLIRMASDARTWQVDLDAMAAMIIQEVRSTDVAVLLPPESMTLMIIAADTFTLPAILKRVLHNIEGRLLAASGGTRPTWSVGASCYPKTATNAEAVLTQANDLVSLAQTHGGDRFYLPS